MSAENFLSRWSRRKQAVSKSEEPPGSAAPAQESAPTSEHTSEPPVAEETGPLANQELSAEEIARLPSLEELTAETDLSVFLRRGVPEPLRKAALRRMWLLDPKIRDYVSEAREYAYDWNTPGGVPGFGGALPSSEEVARMAARIVRGERLDPAHPDKESEGASSADPRELEQAYVSAPDATAGSDSAQETSAAPGSHGEPAGEADDPASGDAPLPASELSDRPAAMTEKPGSADEPASIAPPRRHGAAIPL